MVWYTAGLWGLFGGFAVEGLEFYTVLRRNGRLPWRVQPNLERKVSEAGPIAYLIAEVIRLTIGAGLAVATAATEQISGPLGALGIGVAAPTIIGQLAKGIAIAKPGNEANESSKAPVVISSAQPLPKKKEAPITDPDATVGAVE